MKTKLLLIFIGVLLSLFTVAQEPLDRFDSLLGDWKGTGKGFSGGTSIIQSSFETVMNGQYILVKNNSVFQPSTENPAGDNHSDWGMISFDKSRNVVVYRQFNNEGYINQYVLNDSLSTTDTVVFITEEIENFVPGGKARFTIFQKDVNSIETVFDVAFPNKEFGCFGTNTLSRK